MTIETKLQRGLPILDRVIPKYLEFQKVRQKDCPAIFQHIFGPIAQNGLINHLLGHWKGKKRAFDAFYLNLDHRCDRKLLEFWGETVEPDKLPEDAQARFMAIDQAVDSFDVWPFETHCLFRFLRMAYNNSPGYTAKLLGIDTQFAQSKIKDYGDGTSWGKWWVYLLKKGDFPARFRILEYAFKDNR